MGLSQDFSHLSVDDPDVSIDLPRISPERDTLTGDDHKALDAKILMTFSSNWEHNKEPPFPSLLFNIVNDDKRLQSLTFDEANNLLEHNEQVKTALRIAWRKGEFRETRQLAILWPRVPSPEPSSKRRPKFSGEDLKLTNQALQSAWSDNYSGNYHELLLYNINQIPRTKKAYSNQISIVQSSGTGKSRMVHEQANLVFTIPFNLRPRDDSKDLAFPFPDHAVRDYLVSTPASESVLSLRTSYLKLLDGVFTLIKAELDRCEDELSEKQIETAEQLATYWSSHLVTIRKQLYQEAIESTKKEPEILPEIEMKHEKLLSERRKNIAAKNEDPDHIDYGVEDIIEFAAAESARQALGKLITKLSHWDKTEKIRIVIYFDEAHTLTRVKLGSSDEKSLYDHLCSCFNHFLASPIFVIFLSTNSSLVEFAAPRALAKSARIRGGNAVTNPPITETPFDCMPDLMVEPGVLTTKDIGEISFMAKFGRPLFWTLLRGAGLRSSELESQVMDLAQAKLVAMRDFDSSHDDDKRMARMAVLDVQLSLGYEPRREKVKLNEATLVESYMRIAYSIPKDCEYLRSGYPSEPLLAEAAARQLWTWRAKNPFVVVDTLTTILETGLLDRGELGELTGRHLLLDAYHRAVEKEQSQRDPTSPPNFSAGCHLVTFIDMLYNDECAQTVLDSTPDNMDGISFKEVFRDARVCFTHFGQMADDTGVTSAAAWVAFVRHMGIICRHGERTVDCIIPVLMWNTRLCKHVITGILIQFKRRKKGGAVGKYSIDQADLKFFPDTPDQCVHGSTDDPSRRPYISMIMELGVQPRVPGVAETSTIFQGKKSAASQKRPKTPPPTKHVHVHETPSKIHVPQHGAKHHPVEGHARYNIFAYGCSPTVYRGINDLSNAKYALLLRSRDFLGEHPRRNEQSIAAVRRMKPFWSGGQACYHWVKHDDILHGSISSPD